MRTSFSEQSAIKHIGTPLGIICFFSFCVFEEPSYKMYNTDWVGLNLIGSLLEGDTSQGQNFSAVITCIMVLALWLSQAILH